MSFTVARFEFGKDEEEWNDFILEARNSTFLFHRGFMDYHKDRFTDHSVLVRNEKGKIIACFPANEVEGEVHSHMGLTYGSFILEKNQKLPITMEVYRSILKYYFDCGVKRIVYKAFPRFYNHLQTDEIEYCLFRTNASLYRKDTSIAVDRMNRILCSGNVRREAQKAIHGGVTIQEEESVKEFWIEVLTPNLLERYGARPVHSAEEMTLLKARFPESIRYFSARSKIKDLLAGTILFVANNVVHCQYISASTKGRESGALNLLFTSLLNQHFLGYRFFDFGTTNENEGKSLNTGLLAWKERLGGRAYAHDFYIIETSNWICLVNN